MAVVAEVGLMDTPAVVDRIVTPADKVWRAGTDF